MVKFLPAHELKMQILKMLLLDGDTAQTLLPSLLYISKFPLATWESGQVQLGNEQRLDKTIAHRNVSSQAHSETNSLLYGLFDAYYQVNFLLRVTTPPTTRSM